MIPEEVGKGLDATKEVAQTAGKALDTLNGFGGFLEKVLGPLLEEVSGGFADQVMMWRKMNLLEFDKKFQERCEALGYDHLTLRAIPISTTYKVIEAVSLEESNEIRELWAELLAKSVDPKTEFVATKMHISMLKEIGPNEAHLLKSLFEIKLLNGAQVFVSQLSWKDQEEHRKEVSTKTLEILETKWNQLTDTEKGLAIQNLRRLGCISYILPEGPNLRETVKNVQIGNHFRSPIVSQIDPNKFNSLIQWLMETIGVVNGSVKLSDTTKWNHTNFPTHFQKQQLEHQEKVAASKIELTEVGQSLVSACIETLVTP